ncbi:MAG TPA: VWA domain-containing protein [Terracidiphilus sp.]
MRIGPHSVMRWVLIPFLLAYVALPAWAAKRISVAQLEQTITADRAAHKSDIEIARKIISLELSERLTETALARLNSQFDPSSPAAVALLLLADRSAFLNPPAAQLPANPPPDIASQQHLLQAAQKFAIETLPSLPNLLATRTTFSFDDSPQETVKGGYRERLGMHLVGTSKNEVSVRNDKGAQSISASGTTPATGGLLSWGEFGSALLIILGDSAQGKTNWSHWEQTSSGLMAVFHYEVPKGASHFEVDTSVQDLQSNGDSMRWAGARARDAASISTSTRKIHTRPPYQGSLWIDPATGNITRLTIIAELKGNPTFDHGAILVEYGPVQIADKILIVPVRSLALSTAPSTVNATLTGTSTEWLNENLFSDYHLFASTVRILSDANAPPSNSAPSPADNAPLATTLAAASHQPAPLPTETPVPPAGPPVAEAPLARPSPQSASSTTSEPHSEPPITTSDSAKPRQPVASAAAAPPEPVAPSTPQQQPVQPSPDKEPILRVNVNALLVPVVVRDKKGNAVGGLSQQDFQLFDQGKLQPITGFSVVESAGSAEVGANPTQPTAGLAPIAPHQTRFLVFLFDDRHLDSNDLSLTQKAALRAIDEALVPSDYAAVFSLMGVNSGMTQDRAALKAAVMKLTVHRAFQHDTHDCPDIDYYSADRILNFHDQIEFQIAVGKVKSCEHMQAIDYPSTNGIDNPITAAERLAVAAANHALALGDEDARESLGGVEAVIRALGKLDGQRILVLVSPGFLSLSPSSMTFKSHLLDQALASNVIVNTLDARGLYSGNVDASEGPNMTSNQAGHQLSVMQESENALAEIANGTGGTFFHNNNDLAGGLKTLVAPPQYLYLLQISLNGLRPLGAYHHLHVKVDRPGAQVQSRTGYFLPKESKSAPSH